MPRPIGGLNPQGRGPQGLIGFVFRVCFSFQKIKNLVLFLVIPFGSGYSGFLDNLLFYPRPGLFLKRLSAKKFFKKFFYIRVEKGDIFCYIRYVTNNIGYLRDRYDGYWQNNS